MSEDCHPTESALSRRIREVKEQEDKRDEDEHEKEAAENARKAVEIRDNLVWVMCPDGRKTAQFGPDDSKELRLMGLLP
jgi:hypothetical protein